MEKENISEDKRLRVQQSQEVSEHERFKLNSAEFNLAKTPREIIEGRLEDGDYSPTVPVPAGLSGFNMVLSS